MTTPGEGGAGDRSEVSIQASSMHGGHLVQAGNIFGDVVLGRAVPGVDAWAEGLAQGVRVLWQREEEHRRVHDPVALPVRWHPADAELADHRDNVHRAPAGATTEPLALHGRIEDLATVYRRVPSGRLVILGRAGAGKTVLAARLALDLLAGRAPGDPVPVIFGAGSWNPATTALGTWLAGQLVRDHPGLAAITGPGRRTRADALIEAGRVLPILDGFDEIDAGLHTAALNRLNTTPDFAVVVTSRAGEYAAAVRGADVLTAAAVVELDDLTPGDLAVYLPRTAAGPRTGMWDAVLDRIRAEPEDPGAAAVREVLTNPLMVFLARTIYSDTPGHDPTELLDTHRYPTAAALQDHLLATFLPAVYQRDRPRGARWGADRARRYLTYLAGHLHATGTRDLAWWQLRDTVPRPVRTLVFALVDGLAVAVVCAFLMRVNVIDAGYVIGCGAVAALASGLTVAAAAGSGRVLRHRRGNSPSPLGRVVVGAVTGTVVGVAVELGLVGTGTDEIIPGWFGLPPVRYELAPLCAVAAGLVAGLAGHRSAGPRPMHSRLRIRGRGRLVTARFAAGFGIGFVLVSSTVGVVVVAVTNRIRELLSVALTVGVVGGFVGGLAVAVVFGLEEPIDPADAVTAATSLARDRGNTIRKLAVVWFAAGAVPALALEVVVGEPSGPVDAIAVAVAAAAPAVGFLGVRVSSAWIYWLVLARVWLPLTGRLPWRVHAFLGDAHERGVLRQTGAVYQFRHARLQHILTAGTRAAPRDC